MTLKTASLLPAELHVHIYDVDWGWRIDITTDAELVRLRHPDDAAVIGILALERITAAELSEPLAESLGGCTALYQSHAFLKESERGKGVGIALYAMAFEFALSRDFCLVSSTDMSDTARRLWKSRRLRTLFDIARIGDRFVLLGAKS